MMKWLNNKLFWFLLLVLVVAAILLEKYRPWASVETDDAYVNADSAQIGSQINGQIAEAWVHDKQHVSAGQLLISLDPKPFILEVASAKAALQLKQTASEQAYKHWHRMMVLYRSHAVSSQALEDAKDAWQSALSDEKVARMALKISELHLQYTHIISPGRGQVTGFTNHPGDVITAYQPLFAWVSDQHYWIDANFKESDLHWIKAKQTGTVVIDAYLNEPLRVAVSEIDPATGAAFSLLPPENATGNWVKITQRVPVRLEILNPPSHPLQLGSSATVKLKK